MASIPSAEEISMNSNGDNIVGSQQSPSDSAQQNSSNAHPVPNKSAQIVISPELEGINLGLRRSKRAPQPIFKVDKEAEEEAAAAAAASERRKSANLKTKAKAKAMAKQLEKEKKMTLIKKEKEKIRKQKLRQKEREKAATQKKALVSKNKKIIETKKGKTSEVTENQEPSLAANNWTPNAPLFISDFKTHQSIISRLKNPNMKAIPYAGDVMKLISFINKFYIFFDNELLNLSFQDFEIGLDLYPVIPQEIGVKIDDKRLLYQDYIPVKEVISCQDKMNLLFLTLLKLICTNVTDKSREHKPQATFADMTASKKLFFKYMVQIRANAREWGYPREWRLPLEKDIEISKPASQAFAQNDQGPIIDPNGPGILTENIYQWPRNQPLPVEQDPLYTPELDRSGVLALDSEDRIVLLRTLTDWCSAYSPKVHNEIHYLSHFKKDPTFGVQTQHVPRYFVEGPSTTMAQFKKLCNIVQNKFEIRSKKKHMKKLLADGKREDFSEKLKLLKEIKESMKSLSKEEKDIKLLSYYDSWCKIFKGELSDNPLSNPFDDELYKLRSQEFFVGRVPQIGDFYIPRLHTYSDSPVSVSTYTDLQTLEGMLDRYSRGEIDIYYLFENYGQLLSPQFKLLYHDTPSVIHDTAKGIKTANNIYWYEMCYDSSSLLEFIDFLDYKITPPVEKPSKKKFENEIETKEEVTTNIVEDKPLVPESDIIDVTSDKISSIESPNPTINKKPLPKESRFNASRNKLKVLKEYLSKMYYVLNGFEQLKHQYADMKPGKRALRRVQRRNITYNDSDMEDDDVYQEDENEEEEEQEEEEEEEEEKEDDGNDEYHNNYKRKSKRARF